MSFYSDTQRFNLNDQERLALFVWTVYQDISAIVFLKEELLGGPTYRDFLDVLPEAWSDVGKNSTQDIPLIMGGDTNRFGSYGFVGNPLRANLEAWHGARERMLDEFDVGGPIMVPPFPPPEIPPPGRGGLNRFLQRRRPLHRKRALKWLAATLAHADNLLGSLTGVIPGIAEPLKEIKHAIERAAGDIADTLSDDA
jgi:hypothetical protein